jgi:pimeloyl-ACP methyl ester carboxylesterase
VRLVCPDRPGFGLSEPRPGRAVLDWPADVKALADLLGLERFAVVAISGGGEYGCACAWKLPERVSGLALFSVIGPLDGADATDGMSRPVRLTYATARRAPGVARLAARSMVRAAKRHPEKAFERLARTRPVEDREVIQRPSVREALLANLPEQFCDATSIVHELHLAGQPWPVPLGELTMPVHIFQGGRDDVHTPGMARALAAAIPHAALTMRDEFATFNFLDDLDPLLEVLAGWA